MSTKELSKADPREWRLVDRPLATAPLLSYRYRGQYGWIMIGAMTDEEALREARRSTYYPVSVDQLQRWDPAVGLYLSLAADS